MAFCYAGQVLHVDLTNRAVWKEPLDEDLARTYLGGRGMHARMLWEGVSEKTDPLGPENVLIFGAGPLVGTLAPTSSRTSLGFKSPLTGRYFKGTGGGFWGARLKFAGYDHLLIHGASPEPVYILIDNDRVEIRDAAKLRGLKVSETCKVVKADLGLPDVEVAAIGPAGENLVRFSSVVLSAGWCIGRAGAGAVMGSKNLKAIAVRGTGSIKVADALRFKEVARAAREAVKKGPIVEDLYKFGTTGTIGLFDQMGLLPSLNWQKGHIDGLERITGQYCAEKGYVRAIGAGSGCVIHCRRNLKIPSGRFAGTTCLTMQADQIVDYGSNLGITDIEAIIAISALGNELGLDCMSTGTTMAWVMESVQRGVLSKSDLDGLDMTWGNIDAAIAMVQRIALRQGIGDLLAEGLVRASERVGKDSWKWAMVSGGLEHAASDDRASKSYALGNAMNPRGGDHPSHSAVAEYGWTPEAIEIVKMTTGDAKYADPMMYEKRAEIVRWHEDVCAVIDSLGTCLFASLINYEMSPEVLAQLYSSGTGIPLGADDLLTAGWRILTLERAFNMREGLNRNDDQVPYRFQHDPVADGPLKGALIAPADLEKMKDEYYALRGWDVATGRPTAETLTKLGLGDVAEALAS